MTAQTDKRTHYQAEQLFPMLLFLVFLLCTVFTILIGSRVYENIRERDRLSFETNTALAYITNKVRHGDLAESIHVREENNIQFLIFTSVYDDIKYETRIYQMNGGLYELFVPADSRVDADMGQRLMDCGPMAFSIESTATRDSMLQIKLNDSLHVDLLLRSSQEGGSL